ncbi:DUF4189 domain-containing protein [Lysobacter silvisoli]|uniref:DUF4189 domain-containing protein n=1 Tax=Lysobacter silvisoli TaxID=2293254 RepID=A0A371K487_9GAMM|nr:DUF4189 domain-containing protein [Lysobacter silvisoli]RDZ28736.1 DUF4189 domain-containing protein [Lysobacter silvisoli]
MRTLTRCGLLLIGLLSANVALAEDGCPPGLVPTGRPPGPTCLPMPGYGLGGANANQGRPAPPQPRWLERWGAIAIDVNAAKMGTAADRKTARDAERLAMKQCKGKGGTEADCRRTLLVYGNGCGAVAMGKEVIVARGGINIEEASARALKECGVDTTGCEVLYTKCSYPVLVNNY